MNRLAKIGAVSVLTLTAGAAVITRVSAEACELPVSVSDMDPRTGFEPGGTEIEITGTNLAACGISRVSFGDTNGTGLSVSATTLTVVAPAGTGVVTPRLHYGDNQSADASAFTYVPVPVLERMLPPKGPAPGGTKVIVWGADLMAAAATTEVTFGDDVVVPDLTSDEQVIAMSPPGDPGTVDVAVVLTLESGETATSESAPFTFVPPPTVTSIDAASGPAAGGTVVEIVGTDFQRGAAVLMGKTDGSAAPPQGKSRFADNSAALVVEYVDDTTLLAITPAGTPGMASVVVVNPDEQFGALTDGYTYSGAFPTVTSVAPAKGPSLGGTEVTIVGTGFVAGATVELGNGDDRVRAATVSVTSATQIVATTPPHPPSATAVTVTVTNPDRGSSSKASAFTYESSAAPTLASVAPVTGGSLGGTTLTLTGSGFVDGALVRFGDVAAGGKQAPAAVVDSGRINVTTPAHPGGAVEVRVVNPDGQTSAARTFTFTAAPSPTVATISPATGPTAGGTLVTISGSGFAAGAEVHVGGSSLSAAFDPAQGVLPLVRSANTIVGLTSTGVAGTADVTVNNPDGATATKAGGFSYTGPAAPVVTAIEPSSGTSLGGLAVKLTGTGFAAGSVVTFGNADCSDAEEVACNLRAPAESTTVVNSTTITTATPAGLYGYVDVRVVGPDGSATTLPYGFDYGDGAAPPEIDTVDPSTAATGAVVTIKGDVYAPAALAYIGSQRLTSVLKEIVDPNDSGKTSTEILPVVRDAKTIVGLVPRSSGGTFFVGVANPDGQGVILDDGFSYPVDTTAPTTSATATTGTPPVAHTFGAGNWARGPVSVLLTAVDNVGGSGVDSIRYSSTGSQQIPGTTVSASAATFTVSAQGVTTVSFAATDIAGKAESAKTRVVAIDSVPPSITATSSFVQGTQTNQDVDVVFDCADTTGGSGLAASPMSVSSATDIDEDGTNPLTVTFTAEGLGQSVTATCKDLAGNVSTKSFGGVNITRTGPVLTATATTADGRAYMAGAWTNLDVVVTFVCRAPDSIGRPSSPRIAAVTPPQIVRTGVTDHSIDGECKDTAGNVATATFAGIYIDKTLPLMSVAATSNDVDYTAGRWTNGSVVVTFGCTDDGTNQSKGLTVSGPVTVDKQGTTAGVTGTCSDAAGNRADPAVFLGPILIDTAPPTCSVVVTPNPVGPANGKLVYVVASVRTEDPLSGVDGFTLVSVVTNRPATGSSDIRDFVPGTASTTGSLKAARGNIYTFTYVAVDRAGNESEPCTTQVPVR